MALEDLRVMKCVPCEGGVPPLAPDEAKALLAQVSGWAIDADGKHLSKEMRFENFLAAMAFLNAVAKLAEDEGHHPDFTLFSWNRVRFTIWTHAIGGLSRNDFILAAKIDQLQTPA